ncbi:LAME_0F10484g1_1 [Lachancea meyersii CBS 8951]|uniref:LAME_0F10484g1_1 n=1 Tax=Lachancea meyersii CBS 8951 TaxID=1266667 RepID=A0A1G4JVI5_9SACH|nr:LAME_0F10484g1_1 [Lachancea meyersii CBS 8951]
MFTHSHAIRSGLSGRLRQSQQDHINNHHNAQYIIAAEFNNKVGPVLKHQYPNSIPGFKTRSNSKVSTVNIASLMIPNNAENVPERADFTIFILYKNKYTRNYQIFPIVDKVAPSNDREALGVLKEEEHTSNRGMPLAGDYLNTAKEPPLFFISVVNTIKDDTNDRGAVIKAIALGTELRNFLIFKPLLAMTLDAYMRYNGNIQLLMDCFNMINSLDLSLAKRIRSNTSLQTLLNSLTDERVLTDIFKSQNHHLSRLLHLNNLPRTDSFGNIISFKRHLLEYQFNKFKPKLLPTALTRISLQINVINYDPVQVNINYNDHVLKFLSKFLSELEKLPRPQFAWKLVVNSTKLSKDTLTQFIISLSNLIRHFDFHYFANAQVIIFPYMDISFIDALKEHLNLCGNTRTFTIVGVSNPIFELQKDAWDFYYDMDTESLRAQNLENSAIAKHATISQESLKSSKIRNIFQKRASSAVMLEKPISRCSLTSKMIEYLISERHDNETILNVFKRINVLQILSLLTSLRNRSQSDSQLSLKDEYVVSYRDFIIFPEFFEYGSLKLIRCLKELQEDLNCIIFDGKNPYENHELNPFERIFTSLKFIYKFIASNAANVEKFINIGLSFPLTFLQNEENLSSKDFIEVDLKELFDNLRNSNSMESLTYQRLGVVDYFAMNRFLRLLFLPLLLDFTIESSPELMRYFDSPASGYRDCKSKKLTHSEHQSSPVSSWYNEEIFFQDVTTDEAKNRVSSSGTTQSSDSILDCDYIINKIKRVSLAIVRKLQRHPIGELLIKYKLNPAFKSIYDMLEDDSTARKRRAPGNRTSLTERQTAIGESSINVSPNRMELLKDLQAISAQQESIKAKPVLEDRPARASILDMLNRITVNENDRLQ